MPKELTALRLDAELLAAMRRVKGREGIPITTQIEFALREWLKARGALPRKQTRRDPERKVR
jgi:hypothetical protein